MKKVYMILSSMAVSSFGVYSYEAKNTISNSELIAKNIEPGFDCYDVKFLAQTNQFVGKNWQNIFGSDKVDNFMKMEIVNLYNAHCKHQSEINKNNK